MTEEFDTQGWTHLPGAIITLTVFVLLGLVLEYGIRRLDKLAEAKEWHKASIVLYALRWQGLFWVVLLGISWALPSRWLNLLSLALGLNFFTFFIRIAITIFVVRLLTGWIELFAAHHNLQSLSLLKNSLTGFAILAVLLVVLASVGFPIEGLLIALVGSSVVLSLALQQPLSNLFGGIVLAASNRFKQGDYIRLDSGEEGYVVDVDWFTTTIRQMENNVVDVPNATMVMAVVINYDRPDQELLVFVNIAVGREEDVDQVERVTLDVAGQVMADVPGGVPDWKPFIRYPQGLADFVIRFAVALRFKNYEAQYPVTYEFSRRLQERYRQEGITIPFPFAADYQPEKLAGQPPTQG